MTTLAVFEDGVRLAVDHRGNLMVNTDQFPEGALDIINPCGLTELLCNSQTVPEVLPSHLQALNLIYG